MDHLQVSGVGIGTLERGFLDYPDSLSGHGEPSLGGELGP